MLSASAETAILLANCVGTCTLIASVESQKNLARARKNCFGSGAPFGLGLVEPNKPLAHFNCSTNHNLRVARKACSVHATCTLSSGTRTTTNTSAHCKHIALHFGD